MSYQNNEVKSNYIITPPDKSLIMVSIFIIVIGILSVFSAGSARAISEGENPLFYFIRHIAWLIGGIGACAFITYKIDYKKLRFIAIPFAIFVLVLLFLTAYTPLGVTVNGARRWLDIGYRFQPSEFAKLAVILCFADIFSKNVKLIDSSKYIHYIMFFLMLFLIIRQPNLSMTILLLATVCAIYFCAGGSLKLILTSAATVVPLGLLFLLRGFQKQRILMWINPKADPLGAGYNIIQSLIAFAEGGFFGVGYGNSKQKLAWLPEGHTDFIFSVFAEEWGFIGCLFLIILFMLFIRRGFVIASRTPDMFGKLVAFGITFSIGIQAFINMGVASSFLPASGVPLPFVSYGGSSLFITMCMLGILLNISRKKVQKIIPNEAFNG